MEQLSVLMKLVGCSVVTLVGIVLLPLSVLTCIEYDIEGNHEFLGKMLMCLWVAEWIFVTAFLYNTIFG